MRITRSRTAVGAVALATATLAAGAVVEASSPNWTPVPSAQTKAAGMTAPNALPPELADIVVAQGANALENPAGLVTSYGYYGDGTFVPGPGGTTEATKSEPDKNTYLVIKGLRGSDPDYEYGTHFLFQGHEGGPAGFVTRINLDADAAHRVTLIGQTGKASSVDGSTWYPFSRRLVITGESAGDTGGVFQLGPNPGGTVDRIAAAGFGGYEGVQSDDRGALWLVQDIGGSKGAVNTKARQPNSFLYRLVPADRHDLTAGGKLQVLQVVRNGAPIVFHPGQADADIQGSDIAALHTPGLKLDTRWVTIHDTAVDGSALFDANALAKTKGGTPFKRPENGVFRPDGKFREFYFTETGDTDANTQAGAAKGGFGAIFHLKQSSAGANSGQIDVLYVADLDHAGLDNINFLTGNSLVAVQDGGDLLHDQTHHFDSAFAFDVRSSHPTPKRLIGEGRDASATIDSGLSGAAIGGYQNEGDNEITGFHVSNGDPGVRGLLGAHEPKPFDNNGWRVFWSQQHGDNTTFEIVRAGSGDGDRGRHHR
jgi:hypothetical protein